LGEQLWSFDPATQQERLIGPEPPEPDEPAPPANRCATFAKAGTLEACGKAEDLFLSRQGQPVGHFHIQRNDCLTEDQRRLGPCDTPFISLDWSPNGKWLLAGELGYDTNSSAPQSDFYVVNALTMRLEKAVSAAQQALWIPGRVEILYATPRHLEALPGRGRERDVWVQQLMLFDPATGTSKAITSGVSNNVEASPCQ